MFRQAEALADDVNELSTRIALQANDLLSQEEWASVDRVYLTGSGDSHHASCATEMAFESLAGVPCEPLSSLRFLKYGADGMSAVGEHALVIATSASGGTERVRQCAERARHHGGRVVALTGAADSPLTRACDRSLVVGLPRPERSVGIRTHQASLLGLLMIAIRLGEARGAYSRAAADALRAELAALAGPVNATSGAIKERCRQVAHLISDAPVVLMVGAGPGLGTALFGAAKIVEASAVFAMGQDLEEWCHVERFADPADTPLFLISCPGRAHSLAGAVAARATALGRRVIAVVPAEDTVVAPHAHTVLPVYGTTREEFSPLLYGLFAPYTAAFLAERLGRLPFRADRPGRLPLRADRPGPGPVG
ncbi:SIS domain-containing protein [Streptomyces sp. NPDC048506]|uniref:SIS domain-containing protein n=1 Tax=Streptomyces sp. NPDC048506 TaxID=3155028 RepID=UPI00342F27AE